MVNIENVSSAFDSLKKILEIDMVARSGMNITTLISRLTTPLHTGYCNETERSVEGLTMFPNHIKIFASGLRVRPQTFHNV